MAEEPTLPRLSPIPKDASTQRSCNTRKRDHGLDIAPPLMSNSSDPAIFSSDDDPTVDNYVHGRRRKKRYVGSWFHQQPASGDSVFSDEALPKPQMKRSFKRQFDSGVWMGSDISTDMEESSMEVPQPTRWRFPLLMPSRSISFLTPGEEMARERVSAALEAGEEDIDLTSLGLEQVSNATIASLSEFTCIPTVAVDVPFEQKDPALKLYLASNPLRKAPGAVFNIEFLTVLSLRNTKITELPPALGNLRNLETLNVSLNRLRFLPAELLDLITYPGKLKNLMIHPNPFHRPAQDMELPDNLSMSISDRSDDCFLLHETIRPDGSIFSLWLEKEGLQEKISYPPISDPEFAWWQAVVLARSPVQYNDSRGVVVSKYHLPEPASTSLETPPEKLSPLTIETEDLATSSIVPHFARDVVASLSHHTTVLSLLELSLKSCAQTTQLPFILSYLQENAPHLSDLIDRIIAQRDSNGNSGDLPCSTCRRRVIVPTAQWIEFWDISRIQMKEEQTPNLLYAGANKDDRIVPFMKRACCWNCAPKAMNVGTRLAGTLRCSITKADG